MTDRELTDLLERTADRITVGAVPLSEMRSGADRLRRRRGRLRAAAAAVGVVAVVGGVASVAALGPDPDPAPDRADAGPTGGATGAPTPDPVPAGRRLVGVGSTAIAVPEGWATNALRCGTPTRPTVVVDVTVIESCGIIGATVYDNVWVEQGVNRGMFRPDDEIEIDGVAAQRSDPVCTTAGDPDQSSCTATVYIPSADASYRAVATTAARVEEILSWVRVLPDLVAVPGYGDVNVRRQDDDAGAHYRTALEAAGLEVEVRTESRPGLKAGYVLEVSPGPGTMLEPGDTVVMTEVAEPAGPAEEVNVEVNSVGPGDSMDYRGLTDAQLRAGGELTLDLGATVWVYGYGDRIGTLAGEVSGTALAPDDWEQGPNFGRSWEAVRSGTSTITVTITADGEPVMIGTVRVTVR